jgi:hypothetical protein
LRFLRWLDGVWATHFLLQVKKDAVRSILEAFAGCDAVRVSGKALLDTARIYQSGTPEADTETVLGEIFRESPALRDFFYVATKANVMMPPHRSLARDSVIEQCDTSLAKLGLSSIDLFYLHRLPPLGMNARMHARARTHARMHMHEHGHAHMHTHMHTRKYTHTRRRHIVPAPSLDALSSIMLVNPPKSNINAAPTSRGYQAGREGSMRDTMPCGIPCWMRSGTAAPTSRRT